jgi:hypothetical protein
VAATRPVSSTDLDQDRSVSTTMTRHEIVAPNPDVLPDVLGLSADAVHAYGALAASPTDAGEDGAAGSGLSEDRARAALRELGDLREAEAVVASLEEEYQRTRGGTARGSAPVEVVRGPAAVTTLLTQVQEEAREEVLSLVKAPVAVLGSAANHAEDQALQRGVAYRVVLEAGMLREEPRLYDEAQRVQDLGERVRVAGSVPTKLFVVDRRVAVVPSPAPGSEDVDALVVRSPGLVDALGALFDAVWSQAHDVLTLPRRDTRPDAGRAPVPASPMDRVPATRVPTRVDLRVLTMLLAGYTDSAVARELGVSTRTVQRRVRVLTELAGVQTRLQLGWAAARRGWVGSTDGRVRHG